MAFHSKAWTLSTVSCYDGINTKLTAQLETRKKEGLLERVQKEFPLWRFHNARLYLSRPFARSFFKNGLAIKCTEVK